MSDAFDALEHDLDSHDTAHVHSMRGQFQTAAAAIAFMSAGRATVTLQSRKTGKRFTYKLSAPRDDNGQRKDDVLFVGVLTGDDNETAYSYLGRISRGVFWAGRKQPKLGDISPDAPSAKAFAWSWRALASGRLPDQLDVYHEGQCGRCGRKLTVPESIESGFGPECISKIGG